MLGLSLKSHCALAMVVVVATQLLISTKACADESGMQSDVVAHLHTVATAKLSLAQARYDRCEKRLQSLIELHRLGHATFREVTDTKLLQATLAANLSSAQQLCEFAQLAVRESANSSPSPGDTAAATTTTVTIPGLASDARTQAISRVTLPITVDASAALKIQQAASSRLNKHISARTKAWGSLAQRLAQINDGSPSINNEHAIALLEQRVAKTEFDVAKLTLRSVVKFSAVSPFNVDGFKIASVDDALRVFDTEADRLQHIATATASKASLTLLRELSRRIAIAAEGGASPPAELPAIERMIAANEHRQTTAAAIARSIESKQHDTGAVSSEFTLVSVPAGARLSSAQLASIGDVTLSRVLDASDAARAAMNRHEFLIQKRDKVAALAAVDEFFQNELVRIKMEVAVAQAVVFQADADHQRLSLEHEYVSARIENQPVATWLETLRELYRHQASSTSHLHLLQCRLKLQQWRVDGLTRLHQDGAASWKEMTAAMVQRDEIVEAQQAAELDQATATQILETLNRWAELQATES